MYMHYKSIGQDHKNEKEEKNEERKKKKLVKSSPLKENNECDRMYVPKNTLLNKKQKLY